MLVGIDLGSHKICTLVGEALPGEGLRVLGIGHAPSAGIRRGEVVHVEEAAGAIAASVERAERVAGVTLDHAVVGVTGAHIRGMENTAEVPCGRRPRPITEADVDRALESAGNVPLPPGREILHVLPRAYQIDDCGAVESPIGMEGCRLTVSVHIVTGDSAALGNLRRCLEMAEINAPVLAMSTLMAAEATLTPDERELGAFVIDLGSSITGIACFRERSVVHTGVLAIGGRHMTNDLAVMLQTPLVSAERIKITHGHVLPELDDESKEIAVEAFGDGRPHTTTRHHVSEILTARADELAQLVSDALLEAGLSGQLPAGAVLVGGGSELGGLARRLWTAWDVPVRLGRPTRLVGLADAARGPGHAGAVGLLAWQARGVRDAAVPPTSSEAATTGLERIVNWAKAAFLPRGDRRVSWNP